MILGVGAVVAAGALRRQRREPLRRHPRSAGGDPPLALVLCALPGGASRPRRCEISHRHRPVAARHVRDIQEARRPVLFTDPRRRSLHAVAPAAAGAGDRARGARQVEPDLGQKDSADLQHAARSGARQALRLPGSRRFSGAPLSGERQQPCGALRPRYCSLPAFRPARRHRADRRADPGPAQQSVFP